MIQFHAQSDYLYSVQNTFAHGSGRLNLVEVFGLILAVALPVVLLSALWYYRHYLTFLLTRFFSRILFFRRQGVIASYLVSKGIIVEISLLTNSGIGRNICYARIESVYNGKMVLDIVRAAPTRMNFRGKRVMCFVKQFSFKGARYNSFVTYVHSFERKGTEIKGLTLLTPMRYRYTIRRKHVRKRISRPDMVRVKVWDISKRQSFMNKRPDIYTVPDQSRYQGRTFLTVGNISEGGIRIFVNNPKSNLPSLKVNDQLVMRISIKNPGTKQYFFVTVIGTIRSRYISKGGAVGLGLQFTSLGEKVGDGSGRYEWKNVVDEVRPIARFLEKFQK